MAFCPQCGHLTSEPRRGKSGFWGHKKLIPSVASIAQCSNVELQLAHVRFQDGISHLPKHYSYVRRLDTGLSAVLLKVRCWQRCTAERCAARVRVAAEAFLPSRAAAP